MKLKFVRLSVLIFVIALVISISLTSVNAYEVKTRTYETPNGIVYMSVSDAKIDTPKRINGASAYYVYRFRPIENLGMTEAEIISYYNYLYDVRYPNATRLYTATYNFNCHSYAWHSQNVSTNQIWLDDPSAFYTDGSYELVDRSDARAGDIICYFDNNGTRYDESDDVNLHSGIIVSKSGTSNLLGGEFTVKSKWGPSGLYQHNGYECPYTAYNTYHSDETKKADSIRIYRRKLCSSSHTYGRRIVDVDTFDYEYHKVVCTACGYDSGRREAHRWRSERSGVLLEGDSVNYIPYSYCLDCKMRVPFLPVTGQTPVDVTE